MKKTVKSIISFLVVVLAFTVTACGQQQRGGGNQRGGQQGPPPLPSADEIEKMVGDLADELSLDSDQESTVLTLYTDHFEEAESKTKSGRPDRDEMEKFRENFETEVKAVLTEKQQELFDAYQKKKRKERRPRRQ
ncbi:MAG: hypothetical protein AAF348_01395 [Bacteroidota bacterium]